MKKYVKNSKNAPQDSEFDYDKVKKAALEYKRRKLHPTSVALDAETTSRLKALAEEKGIPYQVLMRSFILEGLKRMEEDKKVS